MQIYHLEHNEIDKRRWNDAIQQALNGNIYAYSWYLDSVCEQWEALTNTDYSTIMPLTARRKYGFNYLYRPLLSQQLGIFSSHDLKNEDVLDLFDSLPDKYRLIEISLNKTNPATIPGFVCSQHSSYELDLTPDYTAISSQYSQNNRRNTRKALDQRITFKPGVNQDSFLNLLKHDTSDGAKIIKKPGNYNPFKKLLIQMINRDKGLIWGAYDSSNTLLAAMLLGVSHAKYYYLVPVNTEAGRQARALFGLIDAFIKDKSKNPCILDFEGSDIPGLARFYAGFGAQKITYPSISKNTLPWPVSLFKKT
ncbi:MAG: hypothetical protein J7L96_06860 [Bacteroidales bacterium]|nr:hypothetical protein [Bacteroidales bacterium]